MYPFMTFLILLLFSLLLLSPRAAWALECKDLSGERRSPKIYKISIKGQKRIEAAAIEAKLISKAGDSYCKSHISEDVKSIFAMGFFYDITVDKKKNSKGIQLIYSVVEKPPILKISYAGNSEVDDDELEEATGIKAFEILNLSKVQKGIEKIQKIYEDKGYYLARISYETKKMPRKDGVDLKFKIEENDRVTVKKITFLGNKHISEEELKTIMMTREGGFFSFVSGSGAYKKEDFDRDLHALNFLYLNQGFAQVKIESPLITVTPDKKGIFITFHVQEGEPFNIGSVNFTGDLLFTDEELSQSIETKKGLVFAYDRLQRDLLALQAKYGDRGYAFTNPIPRTRIMEEEHLIHVTFEIDKGQKVYIGEINVKGNSKTRDKVVRRELLIHEGELYNETKKRESLAAIRRLGFFEEVNFIQSTPKNELNIVNIDIQVKERQTGSIQMAAGYSDLQGLILNGQVSQTNLLGRGQKLSAALSWAKQEQIFNVNFTEPYLFRSKWLVGFDVYKTRRRRITLYDENRMGTGFRMGHPLAPYLRGIIGYKIDDTKLTLEPEGDPDLFPVETANGLTSALTFFLIYDKRNDRFMPTAGLYGDMSLEYAGLGGDRKYVKGTASLRYYKNVFWDVVLRNNLNYGVLTSNSSDPPPFDELFLLGGPNTLRGFEWLTIGRRRFSKKVFEALVDAGYSPAEAELRARRPFGGRQQLYYQVELQKPLIKDAGILGVLFYDVGAAENSIDFSKMRSNVGFGFRWFSPIGPLRFEFGFPLEPKEELGEDSSVFHFSIGSPF